MSITDELREYIGLGDGTVQCAIRAIADRIDDEHERMHEALTIGMEPMTEENMARDGWVKLPVDADGVPIRAGDVMEERSGHTFEVASLMAFGGSDNWLVLSDARNFSSFREPHDLRHVKPDSWERIIGDAVDGEVGVWFHTEIEASRYIEQRKAELVERCRRLAGEA